MCGITFLEKGHKVPGGHEVSDGTAIGTATGSQGQGLLGRELSSDAFLRLRGRGAPPPVFSSNLGPNNPFDPAGSVCPRRRYLWWAAPARAMPGCFAAAPDGGGDVRRAGLAFSGKGSWSIGDADALFFCLVLVMSDANAMSGPQPPTVSMIILLPLSPWPRRPRRPRHRRPPAAGFVLLRSPSSCPARPPPPFVTILGILSWLRFSPPQPTCGFGSSPVFALTAPLVEFYVAAPATGRRRRLSFPELGTPFTHEDDRTRWGTKASQFKLRRLRHQHRHCLRHRYCRRRRLILSSALLRAYFGRSPCPFEEFYGPTQHFV